MRKLAVTILVLMLLVTYVTPALAIPPDHSEFSFTDEYELYNCGDYRIMDYAEFYVSQTSHYDQDGNWIRSILHGRGTDLLYNELTGKSVEEAFRWNAHIDERTGEGSYTGAGWRLTIPGYGPVYFNTGREVNDASGTELVNVGRHYSDFEGLCTLLR